MTEEKKDNKKATPKRGGPCPQNGREKECPLCEVSEETLKILKERGRKNKMGEEGGKPSIKN